MEDKRDKLEREKRSVFGLMTKDVKRPVANIDMSAETVEVLPMENTRVALPCGIIWKEAEISSMSYMEP